MAIRDEVRAFASLGPLPNEESATAVQLQQVEEALNKITRPVTREEANLLMTAFGPDDCFGAAWVLLHLIETAPGGPMLSSPPLPDANEWIRYMWTRIENSRRLDEIK